MTDIIKVDDLKHEKTYCAKRPGATTWSLFGEIVDNGIYGKYYKSYNSDSKKKLETLDGVSFKEKTTAVACDKVNTTGGRNKNKSLKANKNKSLKANKNKSLKANKNKSLKANKKKSLKH